jgi:hypothetical protein
MSPADTDDTWLALFERLVALSGEPVVLRVLNTHGQGDGPVLMIPGELRAPETVYTVTAEASESSCTSATRTIRTCHRPRC